MEATVKSPAHGLLVGVARECVARSSRIGVPLQAFVVSRALVVVAGALGAVRLTPHIDRLSVRQAIDRTGPVGYLLSAPVDRWDSGFYLAIASHGYGPVSTGRSAFYPLYPALMRALSWLIASPVIAGVVISLASFLVALLMLHRLTELELGRDTADAAVLLVAFAPLSFFFSAVYTESLFLALSVGSLLAARTGRWRLACALAALASVTHVTGLALMPALALLGYRENRKMDGGLVWLGVIPLALAGFMAILIASGDPALGMFYAEGAWHRTFIGPIGGLGVGALAAIVGLAQIFRGAPIYSFSDAQALAPAAENVALMLVVGIALKALDVCRRRLPAHYTVYAGGALMLSLSSPVLGAPLASVDRYVLTIFPLWMATASWVTERRVQLFVVAVGTLMLVYYTAQVASYAFVA